MMEFLSILVISINLAETNDEYYNKIKDKFHHWCYFGISKWHKKQDRYYSGIGLNQERFL